MANEFYFYPNGAVTFEKSVNRYLEYRKKDKNLKFVIVADKEFLINKSFKTNFEHLYKLLEAKDIHPHSVEFALNENYRRFNANEWNLFKQFNSYFEKKGIKFGFEEMDRVWSVSEVENANNNIVSTANEIRKLNLSSYEKLMMAYLKVTSRKYIEETKEEHYSESRSVYGVLNSNKIVCVGYAELLSAIMEEVGDENIKIYSNTVQCSEDGKTTNGGHRNLIIHINDSKYGINGFYYFDPTWDSGHENKKLPQIAYCLVPLKDIDKIKYQIRGKWLNMPLSSKKKQEELEKQKIKEKITYNGKYKNYISFSSDGFQLTENFLKDSMNLYPELKQLIVNEMNSEVYENNAEYYNSLQNQKEKCKQILNILNENNINVLSYEEFIAFSDYLHFDESLELFNGLVENAKDKRKGNEGKSFVAKLKEYFYTNNNLYGYNYYCNEIEKYKQHLSREGYENYINEMVEMYSADSDVSKEEIRENLISEMSYEQYLEANEFYQLQITNYELEVEKCLKNLETIETNLTAELEKNPKIIEIIQCMNDEDINHLFNIYMSREEMVDDMLYAIKNYHTYSIQKMVVEKLEQIESDESILLDFLQSIDNKSEDKIISAFIIEKKGRSERVDKWLKSKSEAVDLNAISSALKTIIEKTHNELTEQETYNLTNQIIKETCNNIEKEFKSTASNSFMAMANQKEEIKIAKV